MLPPAFQSTVYGITWYLTTKGQGFTQVSSHVIYFLQMLCCIASHVPSDICVDPTWSPVHTDIVLRVVAAFCRAQNGLRVRYTAIVGTSLIVAGSEYPISILSMTFVCHKDEVVEFALCICCDCTRICRVVAAGRGHLWPRCGRHAIAGSSMWLELRSWVSGGLPEVADVRLKGNFG